MSEYLTTKEAEELLKVSRYTLVRWREMGLPHFKIGESVRYDKDEVIEWMEERRCVVK